MATINIKLGVPNISQLVSLDPEVSITIDGDYALGVEILEYLEKFTVPACRIEVR